MTVVTAPERVVHIVYQGRAMCGKLGAPHQWGEGHTAVPMTEHYKSTCNECFNEREKFYDD